jgi:hypothetical protein
VFGDFWRCWRSPESKGKAIRAVALQDLPDLLEGPWSHVAPMVYFPGAAGYGISCEKVKEMAEAYVADFHG